MSAQHTPGPFVVMRGDLFYRPYSVDAGNWTRNAAEATQWRTKRGAAAHAMRSQSVHKGEVVRAVPLAAIAKATGEQA